MNQSLSLCAVIKTLVSKFQSYWLTNWLTVGLDDRLLLLLYSFKFYLRWIVNVHAGICTVFRINVYKRCFKISEGLVGIQVTTALVNSRLDYANAVLYGRTSVANIAKLQRVQNALARVVTLKKRTAHIHPVLEDLHWLPINYRIDYKVASLVHKVRSPAYLQALVSVSDYTPARQLWSSKQLFLRKSPVRTEIARRAFSQAAATIWNDLPLDSRSAPTYERFRSATKKHITNWLAWTDHVTVSAPTIRFFPPTTYGALSNT